LYCKKWNLEGEYTDRSKSFSLFLKDWDYFKKSQDPNEYDLQENYKSAFCDFEKLARNYGFVKIRGYCVNHLVDVLKKFKLDGNEEAHDKSRIYLRKIPRPDLEILIRDARIMNLYDDVLSKKVNL